MKSTRKTWSYMCFFGLGIEVVTMFEKSRTAIALGVLIAMTLVLAGCDNPYLAIGNTASMFVASMLLWSTVKLDREQKQKNSTSEDE